MFEDVTPEQIAWAAGLFEGEGCLGAYPRSRNRTQIMACLGMTDRDVVERFAAVVGSGNLRLGQPGTGGWKACWEWRMYGASDVAELAVTFRPYFGDRRRAKADEVIAAAALIGPPPAERTHCPSGHAYAGTNLVIEMRRGRPVRRCRTCDNRRARERAARRKAAARITT